MNKTLSVTRPGGKAGFNGTFHEPATGWQILGNGYRVYNPVLMRFHSPDSLSPFGQGGLNAYAYCAGDPVNRMDPTGHAPTGAALLKRLWRHQAGGAEVTQVLPARAIIRSPVTVPSAKSQMIMPYRDPNDISNLFKANFSNRRLSLQQIDEPLVQVFEDTRYYLSVNMDYTSRAVSKLADKSLKISKVSPSQYVDDEVLHLRNYAIDLGRANDYLKYARQNRGLYAVTKDARRMFEIELGRAKSDALMYNAFDDLSRRSDQIRQGS